MELAFENGVKEYQVHGVNGDTTIRFNPTDGEFIQRLYGAFETLDKKQDAYNAEIQWCADKCPIRERTIKNERGNGSPLALFYGFSGSLGTGKSIRILDTLVISCRHA